MEPLDLGSPAPRAVRADAAANRELLLTTARRMLADCGAAAVTMDGLAERAGLGKGTVFRHFGSRSGIFRAVFESAEQDFQRRVLSGPPPLGPGAPPLERLIAYGRNRIEFLAVHYPIARAAMDRKLPAPAGRPGMTQIHLLTLVRQLPSVVADPETLSIQLAAALEGPLLLYLALPQDAGPRADTGPTADTATADAATPASQWERLADSWQVLVDRIAGA